MFTGLETMIYNKECSVVIYTAKCVISLCLKFSFNECFLFPVQDDECILQLLGVACCIRNCMRKLLIEDIHSTELHFHNKDQAEKRNYILGFLSENSTMGDSGELSNRVRSQRENNM